ARIQGCPCGGRVSLREAVPDAPDERIERQRVTGGAHGADGPLAPDRPVAPARPQGLGEPATRARTCLNVFAVTTGVNIMNGLLPPPSCVNTCSWASIAM